MNDAGFELAIKLYVRNREMLSTSLALAIEDVESIVLAKAMEAYDGASNGNKTRGGVRKASDM